VSRHPPVRRLERPHGPVLARSITLLCGVVLNLQAKTPSAILCCGHSLAYVVAAGPQMLGNDQEMVAFQDRLAAL